jgi:DNA helicase-2/ATP-dependent DNA helicase PcrA
LGTWLLAARTALARGQGIDLRSAPAEVQWIRLLPDTADQQRRAAAQTRIGAGERTVLIIGEAINVRGRHLFTSQTPGATSVEAVDLRDLVTFTRGFDLSSDDALTRLVTFAGELMTQVGATTFMNRIESIRSGRARTPPTPAEAAAVAFAAAPCFGGAHDLLDRLEEQPRARVYRPEIVRCCRSALRAAAGGGISLLDAVLQARERNRHQGRPVSGRAVGSTLLLKGLEADVAIVTHPEAMTSQNLYVALTRGARRVIICSHVPVLVPTA